jgi:hypothetical protein
MELQWRRSIQMKNKYRALFKRRLAIQNCHIMGQDIKYIITNQNVEIPKQIVHFREGNGMVIPIDISDGDFEEILENASNFKTVNDLIDFMIENIFLNKSVIKIIVAVASLKIDTFVFSCFRDIADVTHIDDWIVFDQNQVIDISTNNSSDETFNDPNSKIELDVSMGYIINKEDRYWCYESAHAKYREFNPELKKYKNFWDDEEENGE